MSERKTHPLAGMASTMTDGVDLMRRMWGMAGLPQIPTPAGIAQFAQGLPQALPNMISPTLDVDELDKRIADLRAVEQWLNLNAGMLRTTIQTMEVQRNTIATLKSFGGSMLASMNAARGQPTEAPADNPAGADAPWPPQRAPRVAAEEPSAVAESTGRSQAPAPTPAARGKSARSSSARSATAARRQRGAATDGVAAGVAPLNATAWWSALQDQFVRVAAAAVTAPARAGKGAGKSSARPERDQRDRSTGSARGKGATGANPTSKAGANASSVVTAGTVAATDAAKFKRVAAGKSRSRHRTAADD